jgi:hypothetical protein
VRSEEEGDANMEEGAFVPIRNLRTFLIFFFGLI